VLLVLAMSSIGVYGIVLAGWASEGRTRCSARCGRPRR
jgi:NADH:ubiquinone oxidoreductase subunit H